MKQFERLYGIIKTLRGDNGCPWDKEQTIASMSQYIIEETYETIDAIDSDNTEDLKEEIGDLMFLTMFVSYIAEQDGRFTVEEAIKTIADKLVRRHPHVFGDFEVENVEEVLQNWEAIKLAEKKNLSRKTPFDGIAKSLPELQRFNKILQKIEREGVELDDFYETNIAKNCDNIKNNLNETTVKALIKDLLFTCYTNKIDFAKTVRESASEFIEQYNIKKN